MYMALVLCCFHPSAHTSCLAATRLLCADQRPRRLHRRGRHGLGRPGPRWCVACGCYAMRCLPRGSAGCAVAMFSMHLRIELCIPLLQPRSTSWPPPAWAWTATPSKQHAAAAAAGACWLVSVRRERKFEQAAAALPPLWYTIPHCRVSAKAPPCAWGGVL